MYQIRLGKVYLKYLTFLIVFSIQQHSHCPGHVPPPLYTRVVQQLPLQEACVDLPCQRCSREHSKAIGRPVACPRRHPEQAVAYNVQRGGCSSLLQWGGELHQSVGVVQSPVGDVDLRCQLYSLLIYLIPIFLLIYLIPIFFINIFNSNIIAIIYFS